MDRVLDRRQFLGTAALTTTVALAGCTNGDGAADPDAVDTEDRPSLGSPDAPVRMLVFEDFACPGCRSFETQFVPTIEAAYIEPGDLRYLHLDYPLPVEEPWSYAVPNAARAVFAEAGNDAFWAFKDGIYEHQGSYSYDVIETVADDVADVGSAAREAAESETYQESIDADVATGDDWGVGGTPTVFIEEERVDNDLQAIQNAIESRL